MGWITIVRHGFLQMLDAVTQLPSTDTRRKSESMALSDLRDQIGPAHQILTRTTKPRRMFDVCMHDLKPPPNLYAQHICYTAVK